MSFKQQNSQVLNSIDKLSQEMAAYVISSNKDKLVAEIEEDILRNEKMKKVKEKNSSKTYIFFSSDSSEKQQKDNMNIYSQNNKINKSVTFENNEIKNNNASLRTAVIPIKDNNNNNIGNSSNKKEKKVIFSIDHKKNNGETNNLSESKENINNYSNINNNINNKKENEIIYYNNNEFHGGNKIIIKNDKEDLEITLSPVYGNKGNEDEINYYKIKSYIDHNKNKFKQNLLIDGEKSPSNNSNLNLTGTFSENKEINKNKINSLFFKDKKQEKKGNKINKQIIKSFTHKNKILNSLKKNNNNFNEKINKQKTFKEEGLKIDEINSNDFSNESNDNVLFVENENENENEKENISEVENKSVKEASSIHDSSNIYSSSTHLINSSYDVNLTTSSNNNKIKNNNLIINYNKNGRNSKYRKFLEKQLKRKKLTELKINKMKKDKELKELKNYYSSPKINSVSLQLVNNKGNYIPLFKRAIEIENEKKIKRMIRQKIQNNNFILNNSNYTKRTKKQINDFFYAQMNWKDKVEQKNKSLKKVLTDRTVKQNSEILNYEMKIDPKSELIILKNRKKNPLSLIDISQNNSTIISNSANRLYKDYEIRQKKLKKLKRELTPSFMPSINKSPKSYYYKNPRKNYRMRVNEQIKEVKIKDYNSSYKYKYQSDYPELNNNNSNSLMKAQKSRNPKVLTKNIISSRFFNKKEKSTAVDSRNTKSAQKVSSEINNNTKLEKINENNTSNEYSHPNSNNSNKNNENKNNKSNANNTLNNLNNISKNSNKENKKIKNNTKDSNSNTKKTNSKISKSKESKESKIDESKTDSSFNNTESKNTFKEILKNKENRENNNNNKSSIKEENKESEENKVIKDNIKDNELENKTDEINKAFPIQQNKKNNNNKNIDSIKKQKTTNSSSNISNNVQKINNKRPIKKSIIEINKNKNKFIRGSLQLPFNRHKSLITKKSSELLITSKYKDKSSSHLENSQKNESQNDSIEINNIDNGNYNLLNDFFTNKSKTKNSNLIKNSLYNYEDELQKDDFFDENFKSDVTSDKKSQKKLVEKIKFDATEENENEEDEEIEEENDGGNKSISWVKKLREISRNDEIKTDRDKDEINRRKKGASTTRSQTKRKSIDKDNINNYNEISGDEKLYMLNLRNSSATAKLDPYTIMAKEEIFYKFFLKK